MISDELVEKVRSGYHSALFADEYRSAHEAMRFALEAVIPDIEQPLRDALRASCAQRAERAKAAIRMNEELRAEIERLRTLPETETQALLELIRAVFASGELDEVTFKSYREVLESARAGLERMRPHTPGS